MIRFPASWNNLEWPNWRSELLLALSEFEAQARSKGSLTIETRENLATLMLDDLPDSSYIKTGGVFLSEEEIIRAQDLKNLISGNSMQDQDVMLSATKLRLAMEKHGAATIS